MNQVLVIRSVKTKAGNVLAAKGEKLVVVDGIPGYVVCETPNHYAGCTLSSLPLTHLKVLA